MANIIIRNYEHYNDAMGTYIHSKRHYQEEMKRRGLVSYEEGCRLAEKRQSRKAKYKVSDKAHSILRQAQNSSDKNGNVKLSGRTIDAMKDLGVKFKPTEYRGLRGGIE